MTDAIQILIVEDDAHNARLIAKTIEKRCQYLIAQDAEQALTAYNLHQPHLVLLDIGLPDGDGYQVCRAIKADTSSDRSSVLFLSGHDTLDAHLEAYEAGGDDFLAKPFDLKGLAAKIDRVYAYTQEKARLLEQQSAT